MLTHNIDGEWEAYEFAKHYKDLGYFGHALEILLHNVLEDEAESGIGFEEGTGHKDILTRTVSLAPHAYLYLPLSRRCTP